MVFLSNHDISLLSLKTAALHRRGQHLSQTFGSDLGLGQGVFLDIPYCGLYHCAPERVGSCAPACATCACVVAHAVRSCQCH